MDNASNLSDSRSPPIDTTIVDTPSSKPNMPQQSSGTRIHPKNRTQRTLNRVWRTCGTLFCWGLFGIGAFALNIVLLLIYILSFSAANKKIWIRKAISKSCLFYLNTMKAFGLLSYSITPEPIIQAKGKLIIANHPSLLDAFFILSMCPNLCCITKEALWKNPFTALIVRLADYIHNGTDDFIEQASRRLSQGENILIFPEGTRNRYDDQLDFKRGAANIAILTGCDIVPILIHCRPRAMQKGEPFYSIPPTAPHFSLATLPTIMTQEHIDITAPKTIQYRHFTQRLKNFYKPLLSTTPPQKK